MGLDQYLYAKQYLSPSEWLGAETNEKYNKVVNAVGASTLVYHDLPSAQVEVKVGYWRKCNQIHQWFVQNCQGGEDDCREYNVDREQLQELIDLCKQVNDNHELASELLPTQGGFFFGSTEYDEYYFYDIEETISMLEAVLKQTPEGWDFYYQSSW